MPPSTEPKRKKERACDACRKRKTKCDGPWVQNNTCTNCLQTNKTCTYIEASKPRGPPKAYITGLEDRLEALESLVKKIKPDVDFSDQLGPPVIRDSWKNTTSHSYSTLNPNLSSSSSLPPILIPQSTHHTHATLSPALGSSNSPCSTHLTFGPHSHVERSKKDYPPRLSNYRDSNNFSDDNTSSDYSASPSDAEDTIVTSLVGRMKMTLKVAEHDSDPEDGSIRFHGRISTAGLVEVARQFKHMHLQGTSDHGSPSSPDNSTVAQTRRPMFWRTNPWESVEDADETHLPSFLAHFPPIDLCRQLVESYFRHCNSLYPLLHRPTFDRQWSNGLYRRNIWFAAVCMLVFAIGSTWSEDERVLPANAHLENGALDWTQAGRHFFEPALDIHYLRRSYLHPSSLFEIQTFALIGLYLRDKGDVTSACLYVGLGLRKAQDVGAHRKKVYRDEINTDDELWKRAFWHLVVFDRLGSTLLGRSPSIGEEDFDLDFPLEVDDEHWEAESGQFKQPPGVPSLVAAFNQIIRLSKISTFASRTLYAIHRAVAFSGVKTPSRTELREQLSQALQVWLVNVPDHLRWRNDIQDPIIAQQSSIIFTCYHMTILLVHRCFILAPSTAPLRPQSSTFITDDPAVVTCLESVRALAHVLRSDHRRNLVPHDPPHMGVVMHTCGAFLLLLVWSLKLQEKKLQSQGIFDIKPPLAQRIEWMMNDIHFYIEVLEQSQNRWGICAALASDLKNLLPQIDVPVEPQMGSVLSPIDTMVMENYTLPSRFSSSIPSNHQNKHTIYSNQSSVHLNPFPRHELKIRCSNDDYRLTPNERDLPYIPSSGGVQKSYTLPRDQGPVYQDTQLDFATNMTSVPPTPFRPIDHSTIAPNQRSFPYISNSMRRSAFGTPINVDHEYASYPQARISGIRSNLGDICSAETQNPLGLDTEYVPISRHSRQFDNQPPFHPGIYPDYLHHAN